MSANPRRVLTDIELLWPPGNTTVPLYVRKGSLVDAAPGSALETAYGGAGNLQDVSGLAGGRSPRRDRGHERGPASPAAPAPGEPVPVFVTNGVRTQRRPRPRREAAASGRGGGAGR
jgi:hypothetical protein